MNGAVCFGYHMSNTQFEKKCKEDDQCLARIFFTDHTECGEQQKFRENFAKFAVRLVEILQQNLRSSSTKLWADLRDRRAADRQWYDDSTARTETSALSAR